MMIGLVRTVWNQACELELKMLRTLLKPETQQNGTVETMERFDQAPECNHGMQPLCPNIWVQDIGYDCRRASRSGELEGLKLKLRSRVSELAVEARKSDARPK